MADITLDATGLKCPLPVLKAGKAVRELKPGGTIEVLATDPGAVDDFEAFCVAKGYTLLEQDETEGVFRFLMQAGGPD